MRKAFLIVAITMATTVFTSCKKQYTCTCTDGAHPNSVTLPKSNKKDAEAACSEIATKKMGISYTCKLD